MAVHTQSMIHSDAMIYFMDMMGVLTVEATRVGHVGEGLEVLIHNSLSAPGCVSRCVVVKYVRFA